MINARQLAACAAGIALTAGAAVTFQAWNVSASDEDQATFVPVSPCRLFDFRDGEFNVGPRSTPLGEGETHDVQVTGDEGDCTIPDDAVAVALNVTALDASAPSFLSMWPADESRPNVSSLNYVPGQAPTPNKVDVKLSGTGAVSLYNAFGTVNVLGDVVGYYSEGLRDRLVDLSESVSGSLFDLRLSQPFVVESDPTIGTLVGALNQPVPPMPIAVLPLTPSVDGMVVVDATARIYPAGTATVTCELRVDGEVEGTMEWNTPDGSDGSPGALAINAVVEVEAATEVTSIIFCSATTYQGAPHVIAEPQLTMMFFPVRTAGIAQIV